MVAMMSDRSAIKITRFPLRFSSCSIWRLKQRRKRFCVGCKCGFLYVLYNRPAICAAEGRVGLKVVGCRHEGASESERLGGSAGHVPINRAASTRASCFALESFINVLITKNVEYAACCGRVFHDEYSVRMYYLLA